MSGSSEERPTAADASVESEAVDEAVNAAADPPAGEPEPEIEMSAAEALARATAAAGDPPVEAAEPVPTQPEAAPAEEPAEEAPKAAAKGTAADAEAAAAQPAGGASEDAAAQATSESVAARQPADEAPARGDGPRAAAAEAAAEGAAAEAAASEVAPERDEPAVAGTEPEPPKATAPPPPDRPELRAVREALENRQPLEGRVIGWNQGGFHLALGELAAFCPRSEMEVGEIQDPESYLDRTFLFRILRIQGKRQRIVVSRAAHLRNEKSRQRSALRRKLKPGAVLDGTVASLKEFGVFVDLGGAQGLVHVSEISHQRVEHPSHVLSEGQQVRVKVLKVEQGGRRISLSMRALEPDPWKDLIGRFPRGAVVKGTVEKANQFGAFIELAPGLTGLLPARSMSIPRETTPARAYPPGKEVSVQIVSIDPRRQRISLALEGSGLEGSRADYQEYQRQHRDGGEREGFNALASAFRRLRDDAD